MRTSSKGRNFKQSYTFLAKSSICHYRTRFSAKVPNHQIGNIFLNVIITASKLKNAEQQ